MDHAEHMLRSELETTTEGKKKKERGEERMSKRAVVKHTVAEGKRERERIVKSTVCFLLLPSLIFPLPSPSSMASPPSVSVAAESRYK